MRKISKQMYSILAVLMVAAMIANVFLIGNISVSSATEAYDITAKISDTLQKANDWITFSQKENGSWKNEKTINDTAYAMAALRIENKSNDNGKAWLDSFPIGNNSDVLAHKLLATGSSEYAESLLAKQHKDGGYGLDSNYTSEVYDTVLALEAFREQAADDRSDEIIKMISFLVGAQNSNGSWSCNPYNDAETALTARAAYGIKSFLTANNLTSGAMEQSLADARAFLSGKVSADMSEKSIEASLYYSMLKQEDNDYTDVYEIVKNINEAQSADGSFYNNPYYTYLVIKYLHEIKAIDEKYSISGFEVSLSERTVLAETEQRITAAYSVEYKTAVNRGITLVTEIFDESNDGDRAVFSTECPVELTRDKTTATGASFAYDVKENSPKVLKVVSKLTDGAEVLGTYTDFIYVLEKPIVPSTKLTDAGINISEHYGYVNEPKVITADYYLLYATNVNYSINVKTKIYCDDAVVSTNETQAILTPDKVRAEGQVAELNISSDKEAVYKIVTEFYDNEKLILTSEESYTIYLKPSSAQQDDPEQPIERENKITQFSVLLEDHCLYASAVNTALRAGCQMLYDFCEDAEIVVKGAVLDGEDVIASNEQKVSISKDKTLLDFDLISVKELDISEEKKYIVKAELYDTKGEYVGERTTELNIIKRPKAELNLTADTNTGEDYCIDFSWNDISSEHEQYGYHILRSKDDGKTWETRSSWNGSETVSVLNIFPSYGSSDFLASWMSRTDTETGEPVGKNLFNIETVYIGDYNSNPDAYLKAADGSYKYDVLMFGTSDCNSGMDLSEESINATQKFIDAGRGVLFGHDTISLVRGCYHPNFSRFAEQAGIKATDYDAYTPTNRVDVVDQGFLTSFPWKISGTLTVPDTHTSGQFTEGSLKGNVWMKFSNYGSYHVDEETGATNDAYLVTNNQIGLIQTGHSEGQATLDECKVFANTLFYLKQMTSDTTARDHSFYDEAAPNKPEVSLTLSSYQKDSYGIALALSSEDNGTTYQYRTEAIPKSASSENVLSNTIVTEAFADMKGFTVITTESEESAADLIKYEDDNRTVADVIKAENGKVVYEINDLEKGKTYYFHIFAVDHENNISAEYVQKVCDSPEILSQAAVESTLTSSKYYYTTDETVSLTAKSYTTGTSINANAVVEICDLNGNRVKLLDDAIQCQLSSAVIWSDTFETDGAALAEGKYMADIKWYINDTEIAKSSCLFEMASDTNPELTLKAEVTDGADYANKLSWNDLNDNTDRSSIVTDYSVVVDVSGSMSGNRMTNAKNAISNFANNLYENDRMSLIAFESGASVCSEFTDNKTALDEAVSKLKASGGTNVNAGLEKAVELFQNDDNPAEDYNKVIILICDGDVNNCTNTIDRCVASGIAVYTINVVNANSTVLQNMSDKTGGKYYYTNVVSDMSEIMRYIKIMSDKGNYYYQVCRDDTIIDATSVSAYDDKGFLDTAAPEITSSQITATNLGKDTYSGYVTIHAQDKGTDYSYVVNAVDKDDDQKVIYSNKLNTTALSGIKGYYSVINTDSAPVPQIVNQPEYYTEANESVHVEFADHQKGLTYYVHTYAVDHAGNVSAENLYHFVLGLPMFNAGEIVTDIATDKETYQIGETAIITVNARDNLYKTFANGVVEIFDQDGSVVDTVESGYCAEIVSYETLSRDFSWNVKKAVAGKYYASIKWFNGDTLVASDTTEFAIADDGTITDTVSTDKLIYSVDESIAVSDSIYNHTSNRYNDVNLVVNIYDADENKAGSVFGKSVSTFAGTINSYTEFLEASALGAGNYVAVSSVSDGGKELSTSKSAFRVVTESELIKQFSGKIAVENHSDKDKTFRYSVNNNGNADAKALDIIVRVYAEDGTLISTISKTADISAEDAVQLSALYNTEPLTIGSYVVSLSIQDSDDNEIVLDTGGFEINFINQYTVTFVNDDGTVLSTQQVAYGKGATAPETPTKQADAQFTYTFEKWDTDFSNITSDTTVTAVYAKEVNQYTVTFVNDDGTVLSTQQVAFGKGAAAPETPTKQADAQFTYTFDKWDTDFSNITSDTTVTAVYAKEVNQYTVTFVDDDGAVLSTQQVAYGKGAKAPETPAKQADAQFTYTFDKWDTDFSNITSDTTVTAVYAKEVNQYTVTFVNDDGTVLSTQQVAYGKGAAAPEHPAKQADAQFTYTFDKWDTDFSNITSDTTVTAVYAKEVNQYTVTFVNDDGAVLSTQQVAYGKGAAAPETPAKQADAQFTYTFDKWDTDFSNITSDTTVTAVYAKEVNQYTVTFVNDDGTVLSTQQVAYGKGAKAPETPTKQADAQFTYTFDKWDTDFSNITSDTTVTAVYAKKAVYATEANQYTVTFVNDDGAVLSTQQVAFGKGATAPETPTKQADAQFTYTFEKWDTDFSNITSNIVVKAVYQAIPKPSDAVSSTNDSAIVQSTTAAPGDEPPVNNSISNDPIATGVMNAFVIVFIGAAGFAMVTVLMTRRRKDNTEKE